jgi:hypothetical protein
MSQNLSAKKSLKISEQYQKLSLILPGKKKNANFLENLIYKAKICQATQKFARKHISLLTKI